MVAPPIPVTFDNAPPPPPSPMAFWQVDATSVTIGLPGLGSITTSLDALVVRAADASSQAATWARLGEWATAQFYAAHGFRVVPGCVVARDGHATIITGPRRTGATLLGLQLTRHGWGLVSDGLAIVDGSGTCRSTGEWATSDTQPAERLFPDYPREAWPSGRDRTRVGAPSRPDSVLTQVVHLRVRDSVRALTAVRSDAETDGVRASLIPLASRVPGATPPRPMPLTATVTVSRPVPRNLTDMQAVSPVAMADLLAPILREVS